MGPQNVGWWPTKCWSDKTENIFLWNNIQKNLLCILYSFNIMFYYGTTLYKLNIYRKVLKFYFFQKMLFFPLWNKYKIANRRLKIHTTLDFFRCFPPFRCLKTKFMYRKINFKASVWLWLTFQKPAFCWPPTFCGPGTVFPKIRKILFLETSK